MNKSIMNKVSMYVKNNKSYIILYVFFVIICFLTPISGDDYANYVKGKEGIFQIIKHTKDFYFNWEGRIVSRLIILIFTSYKILWNLVTPFLFILIIRSLVKHDKFNNKSYYFLFIMSIVTVNTSMFAQAYTWLAGNITYLYPTALTIYYFSILYDGLDNKLKKTQITILTILSIIIPMFTENIGCAFVFGNLLFIIYKYYLKKDVKINWIFLILSILSLFFMLNSPGSANRASSEGDFYLLNMFERIYLNFVYNFIPYTLTRHKSMIILMLICCNVYFIKRIKISKISKMIIVILFNIIPITEIIFNSLKVNNAFYYLYWLLFGIIFILSLISSYRENRKLLLFYLLIIVTSFSSILCMLLVWPWGDRISVFFVIAVSFVSLNIIDKNIKLNNLIEQILKIIYIVCMLWVIFCMFCTCKIENYRDKYIIEQKENKIKEIEVIYNPSPYIWLSNLNGQYFIDTYKQYKGIDKETKLILTKLTLEEYIKIIFSV